MALPTVDFLTNDLNDSSTITNSLGTFWSSLYGGRDFVEDYVAGRLLVELQTARLLYELVDCTSRFDIPIFRQQNFKAFTVLQSQVQIGEIPSFDEGYVFGPQSDGSVLQFGTPTGTQAVIASPDSELREAPILCSSPVGAAVTLIEGVDYTFNSTKQQFVFLQNPFENAGIAQTMVYDETGAISDHEITLFIMNGKYDKRLVHTQFGYVVDCYRDSSDQYKTIVNTIFDALINGSTRFQLDVMLSALLDVPVVLGDEETIEVIEQESDCQLIVTDQGVYKCPKAAVAIVGIGDVVRKGDQLVDTLVVHEIINGELPEGLTSLTLQPEQLAGTGYTAAITFPSTTRSTIVTLNVSGRTQLRWALNAEIADQSLFWNISHANGIASGTTLANALDQREVRVGEPVASNLPTSVNPLEFLVSNLLRYNTFVIKVKPHKYGSKAIGIDDNLIKKILPPSTAYLIQVDDEVVVTEDPLLLEDGTSLLLEDGTELLLG